MFQKPAKVRDVAWGLVELYRLWPHPNLYLSFCTSNSEKCRFWELWSWRLWLMVCHCMGVLQDIMHSPLQPFSKPSCPNTAPAVTQLCVKSLAMSHHLWTLPEVCLCLLMLPPAVLVGCGKIDPPHPFVSSSWAGIKRKCPWRRAVSRDILPGHALWGDANLQRKMEEWEASILLFFASVWGTFVTLKATAPLELIFFGKKDATMYALFWWSCSI